MTTPPLADVPVRTAAELTARWTALLDPPVFGARSLWLAWLDDAGLMLPVVVPVDDVPLVPDHRLLQGLLAVHDAVAGEHLPVGGHLALALCRPGAGSVRADDEEWVHALRDLLDDQIDAHWSLHLAAGGRVTALVEPPTGTWPR
jgi:hypothetical protein